MPNGDGPEFQTRSEWNGLKYFESLKLAMAEAKKDPSVWKISFNVVTEERVRLVRYTKWSNFTNGKRMIGKDEWHYEPIEKEIEEAVRGRRRTSD
jgi:hypothetical protein